MKTNWQTKKLGEVCEVVGGGTPKTGVPEYWSEEVSWVTPKDLGQLKSVEIFDSNKKISKKGLEKSSAKLLPKGSVVLSSRAPIGYVAITGVDMATNQGCRNFVCGEEVYNKFLYYFLSFNTALLNSLGGGSTFKEVSGSKLKEIEIPVPPLVEQKKIVKALEEKLDKVKEAIQLRQDTIANIEKILSAKLSEIYTEGKEKGWDVSELEPVCEKVADGTHDTPTYYAEGIPLITSKNLKPSGIDFENVKFISQEEHEQISKRSGVKRDDLLLAMIGTIGNVTMVSGDETFSIKNVGLIRPNQEKVLGKYIYYFLHNSRIFDLLELRGGTQKFISLGSIRKMEIYFPNLKTQEKIIKELDELRARVAELHALQDDQLADLKSLERAYLHEAFNGELA